MHVTAFENWHRGPVAFTAQVIPVTGSHEPNTGAGVVRHDAAPALGAHAHADASVTVEHDEHADCWVAAANVPATQRAHTDAPPTEYVPEPQGDGGAPVPVHANPVAHGVQAVAAVLTEYEPAAHAVHDERPVVAENVPGEHATAATPPGHADPAVHREQTPEPLTDVDPGGQRVHEL